MSIKKQRALVVGAGIAGTACAIALHRAGWHVVVAERSPQRRRGGYFMGLFATGQHAARRLGAMDVMRLRTPDRKLTWEMDRSGKRSRGIGFLEQPGSPEGVMRGDIEEALHSVVPDRVEFCYATVPLAVRHRIDHVDVTLQTGTAEPVDERFDLLVGADGVRSTVRRLVFGPDRWFHRSLGTVVSAFQLDTPLSGFDPRDGLVIAEPRRSLWIFPIDAEPPTALFAYRPRDIAAELALPPAQAIRRAYGSVPYGPAMEQVLDNLDRAEERLFDETLQVVMDRWCRGRVALIGDAAWCLTLYSGMGASAGIAGAELLAEQLTRHGHDVPPALASWDAAMRPFVTYHQKSAHVKALFFVPSGRPTRLLRSALIRLDTRPRRKPKRPAEGAGMSSIDLLPQLSKP